MVDIKCKKFGECTGVEDPHKKFRCVDCGLMCYEIVDETHLLYYLRDDCTFEQGTYKSHLELIKQEGD